MKKKKPTKTGPKPGRIKIDMEWESAVEKALEKKRPKEGWPEPEKKKEESEKEG
ncbi:MAG: hypothetical protein ABW152_05195 [Candidatus Thiodiazotropha endolucinida]